jgi:NodT family efflux transporter outer membrane factor (OMF) lipoprotein
VAISIALVALSGCSVGPEFVRPTPPVSAEWSQSTDSLLAGGSPADTAWWRSFNDATLDTLVELAYRQNLPLQIAGLRILEARARLGVATGRQYPQVQVAFGSATGVGLSDHAANISGFDQNFWDYQLGFDAAWELPFWSRFKKGVEAEHASLYGTVADYEAGLISLTAEVARTYAVIRTFEVLIAQARANVTIQQDGVRIAESRFRNGATSQLDVTQATTLLESTRSTIPQLDTGLLQSQNALSTLLGQPTGTVQALLAERSGIPTAPPSVSVSVPAEVLRRRPDIRSAELLAAAQCANIGIAKSDLYPRLSLSGTVGVQTSSGATFSPSGSVLSNLFNSASIFYSFGPRLLYPIFNYGRIKNNVRVQDARFEQLLVNYDNVVLSAAQEVEDNMTGYLKAQEAVVYQQNAVTAAQKSADIAFVQYREGAVDYQRVLDAQRSLLDEQNTLARIQSSIATNLIALYKSLGGGWELRQGHPFVSEAIQSEMQHRTNWGDYFSPLPAQTDTTQTAPAR